MGMTVGYARVSTTEQNPARQLEALAGADRIYTDRASGKSTDRPELAELLRFVREGDTVRVTSPDRLARSTTDLLALVRQMKEKGVAVEFIDHPALNTDSPQGELMLTVLAAVAQFERATARERQAEGIAIAKTKGKYRGRKPALTEAQSASAVERLAQGASVSALAREYGVSRQTIYNARAKAREAIVEQYRPVVQMLADGHFPDGTPITAETVRERQAAQNARTSYS
ncbi:recombinase family protein [Dietzia aerolata]|uniref:Recombinase family protein n=3 Tax=Dietzia aerolata TaxID=595984 RepID=A0ABV5JTJ3_9ACTN|nr:recombinase family protein [Dietzia aerolata]